MARLRNSIVIAASPQQVWQVVSRPEELILHCTPEARLAPRIERVEVTSPQASGEGVTWRVTGEFRGQPYWAENRVVAWEEGRRFAYTILRDSLGAHERMRDQVELFELEPLEDGTTRVTRTSTFRLRGLRLRLLFPFFFRSVMSSVQMSSLHRLKTYVEGKAAAG